MAVYPAINAAGITTQFPYTEIDEWLTDESTLANGFSYTRVESTPSVLRKFTVRYPLIQRAEVTVLENFFDSMRGRLGEFEFTDDNGKTWQHTRFDQDEFSVRYNEPESHSVEIKLSAEAEA